MRDHFWKLPEVYVGLGRHILDYSIYILMTLFNLFDSMDPGLLPDITTSDLHMHRSDGSVGSK